VELHTVRDVSIPRQNRRRWIVGTRADVSRGNRAGESARRTRRLISWVSNALGADTFPVIAAHPRAARFAFMAGMMLRQFIAAFFLMPEARGVPLERMNERAQWPSKKSRAAICDAATDECPMRKIKDKEYI
jgi:hypothetical protein